MESSLGGDYVLAKRAYAVHGKSRYARPFEFDFSLLRVFIGVNVLSLIFGVLFSFCGRIAGNILTFITSTAFVIYGICQAGFENYLGTYISFGNSTQAGAVMDYIADYFASFSWTFWLMLIPVGILLLYYIFVDKLIYIN